MTLTQFRRMCVFAHRMVKLQPSRYRKECRAHVREILGRMNCTAFSLHYPDVIDWDNSVDWTAEERAADPSARFYSKNRIMCDYLNAWGDYAEGEHGLRRERPDADGCHRTELFNFVVVCIRAALDVGSAPSGGVVGYTVGDLREMWEPRPLPSWVSGFFEPALAGDVKDDAPVWL